MISAWTGSRAKRAIDLFASTVALVVLSPVIAATAIAVRVKLGAPVLFRQERAGQGGTPFEVVKFRSMLDTGGPDEDRLTRFGTALRASSLDELPQLWNVAKGDMSLVGPRPLPTAYVARYSPEQRQRLEARPGITGWAQVNGRNTADWPHRLALDVAYVENASAWLDVKIAWRTVETVVSRRGVSAEGHVTMREFTGET